MVKKPTAEEARAKNPPASDRPEMASKYAGMTANERPTKKNVRSRIMKNGNYKRGGSPFDRDIHSETKEKMSEQFAGELVNQMKQDDFRELTLGEEERQITFVLAKEFGFCWGVERSIELAWAAREAYPDKTMHITNELIHNPGVNDLLGGMDIQFMEKDAAATGGKRFDKVDEGDVVILPAFGASLEELELLDSKGVTTVDTTCPWVSKVWTTVDKHQLAEMTSLIHGKYQHEEAIATASMCETYLIIKDIKQATEVASYILGEPGCLTDEEFLAKYKHAASPHFDPRKHLKKIGVANQTTMYKKETQAIGRLFEKTMMATYGPENIKEHFAAFDTICDATQVRQDAIMEMSARSKESEDPLDFILVVGGWDSSNTAHLLEIPVEEGLTGYHVNTAKCIRPDNSVEWRDVEGNILVTPDFLPLDRPARIGVTSGASTPDSVVQECVEAIMLVKKLL
jgi:4-hydroxy-3-methylbut-2-enyl diphosphate reductase